MRSARRCGSQRRVCKAAEGRGPTGSARERTGHGSGVDRVYGYSTTGIDRADYYDSIGDDLLLADDNYTSMSSIDYYMHTMGFDNRLAYSLLGGNDTSDVNVVDSAFSLIGNWDA